MAGPRASADRAVFSLAVLAARRAVCRLCQLGTWLHFPALSFLTDGQWVPVLVVVLFAVPAAGSRAVGWEEAPHSG